MAERQVRLHIDQPLRPGQAVALSEGQANYLFAVMRAVLAGHSTEETADRLGVGTETVKTQRKRAYAKLGVSSRTELFAKLLSGRDPVRLN